MLGTSKIGFEISYADMDDGATLQMTIGYYNGSAYYVGYLQIVENAGTLQIWNPTTSAYVTLATLVIPSRIDNWNTMKLVIDMDTNKYVRAMFNQTVYDVSSYSLATGASAIGPHILVRMIFQSDENAANICYLDDAIVTQNEP